MRPSLLLDFANTRRLDPRITFTRASTATYFDRFGVLKAGGVNEPRFDYDPVTGYCKGLLIEEARTNLLTYSEQFDNAAWSKSAATVTSDAATAPDGTATADKLVESAFTDFHRISSAAQSLTSGIDYTLSCYAKAGERSVLQITPSSTIFGSTVYANFDLVNGVVGNYSAVNAAITAVGGGWFRCSMTVTSISNSSSGPCNLSSQLSATAARSATYAGDGVSGLYIWGAQLEAGSFATSYIPTTSATVTRSADVASMSTSGWFNDAEGTFVGMGDVKNVNAGSAFCAAYAADTDRISFYAVGNTAAAQLKVVAGNTTQAQLDMSGVSVNATAKVAAGYKKDDFASSLNGGVAVTDTAGSVPSGLTTLKIGQGLSSGTYLNGHISRLAYYPRRLANADLQELTR